MLCDDNRLMVVVCFVQALSSNFSVLMFECVKREVILINGFSS